MEEIARANPDRMVCISTHAAILRSMQCYWMKKELCEMHTIPWSANASITTVSYEADGSFHDVFVGQATHLEARNITLPMDW